jgi:hypothetical protein
MRAALFFGAPAAGAHYFLWEVGTMGRIISQKMINLPNGYAIAIRREKISHVGRSIFREFDGEQVVLEIVDRRQDKTTKRLPIPASVTEEIAEFFKS